MKILDPPLDLTSRVPTLSRQTQCQTLGRSMIDLEKNVHSSMFMSRAWSSELRGSAL